MFAGFARASSAGLWFLVLNVAVLLSGVACETANDDFRWSDFTNLDVLRHRDLTVPSILREQITISARVEAATAKEYLLAFPVEIADRSLAYLTAGVRKDQNGRFDEAVILKDKYDAARSAQLYKVKLPSTVQKGDSIHVNVIAAYTQLVKPFPKTVGQTEKQILETTGNAYFWSPYKSDKQRTVVRLPGKELVRHISHPEPVKHSGETVTYGPYSEVPAFAYAQSYLHYPHSKAILSAKTLTRTMELSHWGANLAVQEDYELHHEGARLKGHFSRVDYAMSQRAHQLTNVVKELAIALPANAKHIFYRDTIGNVSTSKLAYTQDATFLQIVPRYPLYGGWKYTWHHGYNVPTNEFLKKSDDGQYVFRVPFIAGLPNITIAKAVLSITFPEGAHNFKIRRPFDMDRVSQAVTHTYLDTTGRPTLVFEKQNVVDEHAQYLLITYEFTPTSLLQKPLAVSAAFLALFLAGAIYSRLDLSITKNPQAEHDAILTSIAHSVHQYHTAESALVDKAKQIFEKLKSTKRLGDYKQETTETETQIKRVWESVLSAAKKAESAIASYKPSSVSQTAGDAAGSAKHAVSESIRQLHALQQDRWGKLREMHHEVARLAGKAADAAGVDRKDVAAKVAKWEVELEELARKIRQQVEKIRRG